MRGPISLLNWKGLSLADTFPVLMLRKLILENEEYHPALHRVAKERIQGASNIDVDPGLYEEVFRLFQMPVITSLYNEDQKRVWIRTPLPLYPCGRDEVLWKLLLDIDVDVVLDLAEDVWDEQGKPTYCKSNQGTCSFKSLLLHSP